MDTNDFEIRQPRWLLALCAVLLSGSLVAIVVTAVEMCLNKLDVGSGAGAIAFVACISAVSVFGLVACKIEVFSYDEGRFTYKRIFRKAVIWNVEDVTRVELIKQYDEKSPTLTILFWGNDGVELARVNGMYPVFKDSRLKQLLVLRDIPIEVKTQFK